MKNNLDNYLQYDNVLQDYIDLAEDYFVQIDYNYFIIDCNLKFCEFRNTRRVNILGNVILDFISPDDHQKFMRSLDRFSHSSEDNSAHILPLLDYKGRQHKSVMKITGIRDYNNAPCGYFLKFSKYIERTEDSRYVTYATSVLESLNKLYTVINTKLDGRIVSVNPLVPQLLGYTEEELTGSNINRLYDDSEENKQNFITMQQSLKDKGYFVGEIIQIAKNGEKIPFYLSVTNINLSSGELVGRLGVGRDMREMKKLEEENRSFAIRLESQAKLAEFGMMIQGVAHNLNTPLTGIKSSAQLMKAKLAKYNEKLATLNNFHKDEESEKMEIGLMKTAEMINSSSEKLSKIISNMMAKARQEQSRLKEEINLSVIMEQELEFLMANMFFKHKVEKIFNLQKDLPVIYGIYSDFSQTFVNLIKNGLDAMFSAEKKVLEINIFSNDDSIIVKIRDTGHGIPKEIQQKIFDPFFTTKPRINEAKPGEPTGTGLGLESVISLMKSYQGHISFISELNAGTEFTIEIPLEFNRHKPELPEHHK